MSLEVAIWSRFLYVSMVAVLTMSCSGTPDSETARTDLSTPAPVRASDASSVQPAQRADEALLAAAGSLVFDGLDVTVRQGATGSVVQASFRGWAREPTDTLELDYCGPPPLLLSVDGSTVETSIDGGVLHARLHSSLRTEDVVSLRLLTTVPLDRGAPEPALSDIVGDLLCR